MIEPCAESLSSSACGNTCQCSRARNTRLFSSSTVTEQVEWRLSVGRVVNTSKCFIINRKLRETGGLRPLARRACVAGKAGQARFHSVRKPAHRPRTGAMTLPCPGESELPYFGTSVHHAQGRGRALLAPLARHLIKPAVNLRLESSHASPPPSSPALNARPRPRRAYPKAPAPPYIPPRAAARLSGPRAPRGPRAGRGNAAPGLPGASREAGRNAAAPPGANPAAVAPDAGPPPPGASARAESLIAKAGHRLAAAPPHIRRPRLEWCRN